MSDASAESERSSGYRLRGLQGRVIEAIGLDIVGGRYQPGELLPREAELMVEYGVSRTSLREAMKVLAAKGLVAIRQKVGTRVRPVEMWNAFDSDLLAWFHASGRGEAPMRDLVELRQVLEPAAARFAAARATMPDLHGLERAKQAMLDSAHSHTGYAASDVDFHLAIYNASHNALLRRFGQLVADFMQLSFGVQQDAATEGTAADFTADAEAHATIVDAINRGDADAAAEAMLEVVLEGKRALIKALSQE